MARLKLVRFRAGRRVRWGALEGDTVRELLRSPFQGLEAGEATYAASEVRLLAPCAPSKVVCVGLNYRDHAAEGGHEVPEEPLLFLKPPTAVIGPGDAIVYPRMSNRVDHEAELGVVMGRRARNVTPGEAIDFVLGYVCVNDVTARDLQRRDGQWTRAKGFDTFCPVGPLIDTGVDPGNLGIECRVNGVLKQSSTTREMIFPVPALVSFISQVMTLLPGDLICTGTPGGIGPLQPGDEVEVAVEHLGSLRNRVVAAGTLSRQGPGAQHARGSEKTRARRGIVDGNWTR